jgi:hypothetical protein
MKKRPAAAASATSKKSSPNGTTTGSSSKPDKNQQQHLDQQQAGKRQRTLITSFFGGGNQRSGDTEVSTVDHVQECSICGECVDGPEIIEHEKLCKSLNVETKFVLSTLSQDSVRCSQSTAAVAGAKNAFSLLMEKKPKPVAWQFNLLLSGDGKVVPTITAKGEGEHTNSGAAQPAWEATVSIRNFPTALSYEEPNYCHGGLVTVPFYLTTNIPALASEESDTSLVHWFSTSSAPRSEGWSRQTNAHISVVKSMLQKAIRRQKAVPAARLALKLYRLSPNDFLRRLPIIMIEDGSLHPSLPIIMWLLIAVSKGYIPPNWLIMICIKIVVEISISTHKDFFPDQPRNRSGQHPEEDSNLPALQMLPCGYQRTLVISVLLRASYGGMEWDTNLLRRSAANWYNRFFGVAGEDHATSVPLSVLEGLHFSDYLSHQCIDEMWNFYPTTTLLMSWSQMCLLSFCAPATLLGLTGAVSLINGKNFSRAEYQAFDTSTDSSRFCSLFSKYICDDGKAAHEESELLELSEFITYDRKRAPSSISRSEVASFISLMKLRPDDLVSEGIDFHCCPDMISKILTASNQASMLSITNSDDSNRISSESLVKDVVWTFSSGANFRPFLWIGALDSHEQICVEQHFQSILDRKRQLGPVWAVICPNVKDYCADKKRQLAPLLCAG